MPSNKRAGNANPNTAGISRRDLVKHVAAGAGGLALATGMSQAFAQTSDVIKIGFVSPRTGPLGGFGEGDPYVLGLARKALANGLTAGGKKYKVEIIDRDSQSDPARASQLAKALINSDNVDLMLVTSTPEVVNPVSDACEAAGVPCVSTVMPWEAWYFGRGAKPGEPSPFKWTYHFSFGVAEFAKAYISEWSNGQVPTNKKVGVMFPNDADGNALRAHMIPIFEKAGFTVFDPGGYEDGTTDYSTQIGKYKDAGVQIFTGVPIPPDFATFWRQAAQLGFAKTIKIQSIAKTGLFPSQMEALGSLAYNIASLCYWHPTFPYKSPLTGGTSKELAARLRKEFRTAMEPATWCYAVVARCWRRVAQGERQSEGQGRGRQKFKPFQGRRPRWALWIGAKDRCRTCFRHRSSAPSGLRRSQAASTSSTW